MCAYNIIAHLSCCNLSSLKAWANSDELGGLPGEPEMSVFEAPPLFLPGEPPLLADFEDLGPTTYSSGYDTWRRENFN